MVSGLAYTPGHASGFWPNESSVEISPRGVSNCATGHDVPAFRSPVLDRVRASITQDQ